MKRNFLLTAVLLCLTAVCFVSCGDDDDFLNAESVPSEVRNSFSHLFSETSVRWKMERGYYKAEFWVNGREVEVWFQKDGTWIRTERDIIVDELPEAVKAYVAANYPDYRVDDAEFIETPSGNYYELELEQHGKRDVHLKLTAEGVPFVPGTTL